ncbi:hypothetical protein [Mycoplasma sp. OR1901]|uniref:hypothetical protein n=1 Tax=Mycoplasma sp. OR1901 TaxID=2742195 RepID=UPI0015820B73|nr:hypothetical protein [Mycoplasma sp. OR1901]QKT05243.1 hypothetical protein HTZ87_00785 [Mycoplasma sp. OR1901]
MSKNNKLKSIIAGPAIAAVVSSITAITVTWNWSKDRKNYNYKYNLLKELIDKLNINKDLFITKFNKISPNYRRKEQFHELDLLKNKVLDALRLSISAKEESLENTTINGEKFTRKDEYQNHDNGFDLLAYNVGLDIISQIDSLINKIQNDEDKKEFNEKMLSVLKDKFNKIPSESEKLLEEISNYVNSQQTQIDNLKSDNSRLINSLPEVIRDKFTALVEEAGDNLELLNKLNTELKEYKRVSDLALSIHNLHKKANILSNIKASNFEDLPAIEKNILEILEYEKKSSFDKLKQEVEELNDLIEDSQIHDAFERKIADASETKSIPLLLETKEQIEEYLKDHAGIVGYIKFKKEQLIDKIRNSDLDNNTQDVLVDQVNQSNEIKELDRIEKNINDLIALLKAKKEAIELVSQLENPKKDELLDKLTSTTDLKEIDKISKEVIDIIANEKEKVKAKLEQLNGDYTTKNEFITRLTESINQADIKQIGKDVDAYISNLLKETETSIEKIQDPNKKASLKTEFDKIKENPSTNAGNILDLLKKAKTQLNFEEAKKDGNTIADLIEDKEIANKLKEDLNNAKNLDETLKIKAELDEIYKIQLSKKEAEEAIKRIQNQVKKDELTNRLKEAKTYDDLIKLITDANNYSKIEESNKLKHDQLKDFVNNKIEDNDKKQEFLDKLEKALKDSNNNPNVDQNEVRAKLNDARTLIYNYIKQVNNEKQLHNSIIDRIDSKIPLIEDETIRNKFKEEKIKADTSQKAKELEEKIDKQFEFETTKNAILDKIDKLIDKKDYLSKVDESNSIDQLNEIEKLINQDLSREDQELLDAKKKAIEKLVYISDSNNLKGEWAKEISLAKTPSEVQAVTEKITKFIDDLRKEAEASLAKLVGDDEKHTHFENRLIGAKNETTLEDVKLGTEKVFSDKFNEVHEELRKLSQKDDKWDSLLERIEAAKNIKELNDIYNEIKVESNIYNNKNDALELLDSVQEKSKVNDFAEKLENANTLEEISKVKEQIQAQIEMEKDEIAKNKEQIQKIVETLYEQDNIDNFNEIISNDNLSLEDSRNALKAAKETKVIEANKLLHLQNEAREKLNNLKDSDEKTSIQRQIDSAQNLEQVHDAIKRIDDRIRRAREEAVVHASKLNNNKNLITSLLNAKNEEKIEEIKTEAISRFQELKNNLTSFLNRTLNVDSSAPIRESFVEEINNAKNESVLITITEKIIDEFNDYLNDTKKQLERITEDTILSNATLMKDITKVDNELTLKGYRDEVTNVINSKLNEAQESLLKLNGDSEKQNKYKEIFDNLNSKKETLVESSVNELIKNINTVFEIEQNITSKKIDKVKDEDKQEEFRTEFENANSIEKLHELNNKIELQLKKEELLSLLDDSNTVMLKDQKSEFINEINSENTDSLEKVEDLKRRIEEKSTFNKGLKEKISLTRDDLGKIDVTNELNTKLSTDLDNASTVEEVNDVISQINNKLEEWKQKAVKALEKLNGSAEKLQKEQDIKNANKESKYQSIILDIEKILDDEKESVKMLLEPINDDVKGSFNDRINAANSVSELINIKTEINNQSKRQIIEKVIDILTDSEDKTNIKNELDSIPNDAVDSKIRLDEIEKRVEELAKAENKQFRVEIEKAKHAVSLLSESNLEKSKLQQEIDRLEKAEQSQQIPSKATEIKDKAVKMMEDIKKEIREEIAKKLQPTKPNADQASKESPQHLEKYNDLANLVNNLEVDTEDEVRDVLNVKVKEYLDKVRNEYKDLINENFPGTSEDKITIHNSLDQANDINALVEGLKNANTKLGEFITSLINTVEDESLKEEYKEKLAKIQSNTVVLENGESKEDLTKWQRLLPELKELCKEVELQLKKEKDTLRDFKNNLEIEINNRLVDNTNDDSENSKVRLQEALKNANTLKDAQKIKENLDKKIEDIKKVADATIDLIAGDENHDRLKQELKDATTESKINDISKEVQRYLDEEKQKAKDSVDKLPENNATKAKLNEKLNNTDSSITKDKKFYENIEKEAKIELKKVQLKEKVEELWPDRKGTLNDQIDAISTDDYEKAIEQLKGIESSIDDSKKEQDKELSNSKIETWPIINRLKDKEAISEELKNAKTLDDVTKIKDKANKQLDDKKAEVDKILEKINIEDVNGTIGSDDPRKQIKDLYDTSKLRADENALETTYDDIIEKAKEAFEKYKDTVRNNINSNKSSKGDELIEKINDSETDTIDKLHELENANEVQKKVDWVKEELNKLRTSDQKTTWENEINEIEKTIQPSTDKPGENETKSKKDKQLEKLSEILSNINEKIAQESQELKSEKEATQEVIDLINSSNTDDVDKKNDLVDQLNNAVIQNNIEKVKELRNEAREYINTTNRKPVEDLLKKLTDNTEPKATLVKEFNSANSQTEYNNVKTKVEIALAELRKQSEEKAKQVGDELNDELNTAKTTDTQAAYEEFNNKVETKLEEYRDQVRKELLNSGISSTDLKRNITELINNSNTKESILAITNEIARVKSLEDALVVINKLNDNDKKHELLSTVNGQNATKDAIDNAKQQAETILNDKKQKALEAIKKLEGSELKVTREAQLKTSDTEATYDKVIADSTLDFNDIANKINNDIRLLKDGGTSTKPEANAETKANVNEMKDLQKQAIQYAKEYTTAEINKVPVEKRVALFNELEKAKSVAQANEVYDKAVLELNTFNDSKRKAVEEATRRLEGYDNKDQIINEIQSATDIATLQQANNKVKEILDRKYQELELARIKLESTNGEREKYKSLNDKTSTFNEMNNATEALVVELDKIFNNTTSNIENINLNDTNVSNIPSIQDWKLDYENPNSTSQNDKGVKQKLELLNGSNKTEEALKNLNKEVEAKLNSRKREVLSKINELNSSDERTRLTNTLNDTSKQNYNEFAKVYKEAIERKSEEQRQAKLSEVKALIAKLKNLVPNKHQSNFNQGIDSKNIIELERIKNEVQATLEQEFRLSREEALKEIKKITF